MIVTAGGLIIVAILAFPWEQGRQVFSDFLSWYGASTYRYLPAPMRKQLDSATALAQQSTRSLHGWLGTLNLGLVSIGAGVLLNLQLLVWVAGAFILMAVVKLTSIQRAGRSRLQAIVNALPAQLDLLAMLLAAGQPLLSSLQRSSEGLLQNPLRRELRIVVASIRAGEPMETALQRFAQLFNTREIQLFCGALNHARESGGSLADILREQARHRRNELFLQAEQKALEAPVKLMLPLLTCIFPTALILLVVVLSAKLMWQL